MNRATRLAVLERDNYSCRRCGVHMSVRGYSIHHRKGRHCTDPDSLANLVTLCGSGTTGCHLWAHANPADAYATGWMVRRLTAEDPEDVPLTDVRGHLFGLTADGDVIHFAARELQATPDGPLIPPHEGDEP